MEKPKVYPMPTNFQAQGYWFNGLIPRNNAIEAIGFAVLGWKFADSLPTNSETYISVHVFFAAGFALPALKGIQGKSLLSFLLSTLMWLRRKNKPYIYNSHGGAYAVSAADVALNQASLRDALYSAIEGARESMSRKTPEYIEGETFEFVEDPELERLRLAHEQALEDEDEELQETPAPVPTTHEATADTINVGNILENITMNETKKGGK